VNCFTIALLFFVMSLFFSVIQASLVCVQEFVKVSLRIVHGRVKSFFWMSKKGTEEQGRATHSKSRREQLVERRDSNSRNRR